MIEVKIRGVAPLIVNASYSRTFFRGLSNGSEPMIDVNDKSKVLNDALIELTHWKNKYNNLTEFSKLVHVIEDLTEQLQSA